MRCHLHPPPVPPVPNAFGQPVNQDVCLVDFMGSGVDEKLDDLLLSIGYSCMLCSRRRRSSAAEHADGELHLGSGGTPEGCADRQKVLDVGIYPMEIDVGSTIAKIHIQTNSDELRRTQTHSSFADDGNLSSAGLASSWLQQEAKRLEEMYGLNPSCEHPAFEVDKLKERCMELGIMSLSESRMDEEQEREVDHEIEREQQVERPPKAKAATHCVHGDIKAFIRLGLFLYTLPQPFRHSRS
ncbi:hypothetical protein A0H81_05446 [Grifola frondosa]|uniref:Uncharacterized protein n=1 Tax=Grifola frondosa TaxID=5627 RepID=A0A1C7ME37_GRIFR|nr:hypothetical protein A0H81_05446 [Grifola frondosa]